MNRHLFVLIVLAPSLSSAADDSWLCIGEESAAVTQRDGRVAGSTSGPNKQRFLVDRRGVKFVGHDDYLTSGCDMTPNGEPAQCFDKAGLYTFRGYGSNLFVMSGVGPADGGGFTHWIIAGTCERIEQ